MVENYVGTRPGIKLKAHVFRLYNWIKDASLGGLSKPRTVIIALSLRFHLSENASFVKSTRCNFNRATLDTPTIIAPELSRRNGTQKN